MKEFCKIRETDELDILFIGKVKLKTCSIIRNVRTLDGNAIMCEFNEN